MEDFLRQIDELVEHETELREDEYLNSLARMILRSKDHGKGRSINAQFLFQQENEIETQQLISYCFVRIIGNRNQINTKKYKHQILRIIQHSLPELCKSIGINDKVETYEKEKILRNFIVQGEKEFSEIMREKFNFQNVIQQQALLRKFANFPRNAIFQVFTGGLLSKSNLDGLFNVIKEYTESNEEEKYSKFVFSKDSINKLIDDAISIGTKYSIEYAKGYLFNIQEALIQDIEKSPFYLPCELQVQATEKKYPFSQGTQSRIELEIKKIGKGYAHNTIIRIMDSSNDALALKQTEQRLGQLRSETLYVEFPYEVKIDIEQIQLDVEILWNSALGESITQNRLVELHAQAKGIDWEAIQRIEPYSLEPIESDFELIGRAVILQELRSMLTKSIGSAYLFGQRRVGKTSIVKSLLNSNKDENLLIYYIEAGDWNDAQSAFQSMDNLAERICKKIRKYKSKFSSVEIPLFNGSFTKITNYLDDIADIDPNFKLLLILDEFDRISSTLYERGDVGGSFVLTLRAISNRPNFGIVLVGGEKLEFILSPWQEFNRFSPIRVDYFSKERDWEDFKDLIRKPVEGMLEISDSAINLLHEETAGNPYFTKKICMKLFSYMVRNRDVHVTATEVSEAISWAHNSANIGVTDFSHFWEDGIKGPKEKEAEISIKRRKVLIAISQVLRNLKPLTKANISDSCLELSLKNSEVDKFLLEFAQRRILFLYDNEYHFVVQFFKEWLLLGGTEKIVASFEEEEKLLVNQQLEEKIRIKPQEIAEVLLHLQTYKGEGISVERVRNWLNQFEEVSEQRLMFKLLQNFKLYSETDLRRKLVALGSMVAKDSIKRGVVKVIEPQKKKNSDILVSYLDKSPAKGASYLAKIFADENNIYSGNVCSPESIEGKITEGRTIRTLVLIDDFIGSGDTMVRNSKEFLDTDLCEIMNQRKIMIVFGVITGYQSSIEMILQELDQFDVEKKVLVVDPLNEEDKCFSSSSKIFATPSERKRAREICRIRGESLEPNAPLGYANCEALIAFPMNCPNNTLPIFWKKKDNWVPLFERK